jgi:hypothetical protein
MDSNWAGLRELMTTCPPPRIVYLGAYLADLTYINEMKTKSSKTMYNFKKLSLNAQAIDRVLQHHDKLYALQEVPEIRRCTDFVTFFCRVFFLLFCSVLGWVCLSALAC